MNIKKLFSRFLELLGLDIIKYKNKIVVDRDGVSYSLKNTTAKKIREFVRADFFADNNALILLDYKEDTKQITESVNI